MSTSCNESFLVIVQGNIAVPTGNPFDPAIIAEYERRGDGSKDCLWIGPGLKILLDHVVGVNENGVIVWLAPSSESQDILQQRQHFEGIFIQLDPFLDFLCPGMIDLHIHAPQFAYTGTATDRPLTGADGWLAHYTFPAEARLQHDTKLANQVYEGVVKSTLKAGTTTAVYFATLHLQPTKILVDMALEHGQRALIGKVCMDRNAPDDYVQTLEENIQETKELIEYIHNHPQNQQSSKRVLPLITPRFIPTCTPMLLTSLGDLAKEYKCHITSHISESHDEVAWSRHLDKEDHGLDRTDAFIFNSHNLLTERCIMAHGVHLTESDAKLLRQQGSAIAHCPLSNFCFAGGNLDCQKLLRQNNKVGLGTDVAGGYSPSMLNSTRMAVVASQACQMSKPIQIQAQQRPLDYRHAVYLATLAGAEGLGLQEEIGTLRIGMQFDAMILSAKPCSMVSVFPNYDTLADVFQKLWVLGDDRNVKDVFVQGQKVK